MLTGEPDAGNLPVRFGGRGGANQCAIPTPYPMHEKPPGPCGPGGFVGGGKGVGFCPGTKVLKPES